MLFFVISASLLLWITTSVAEKEVCTIPSILNGAAGKYIKVRFSRAIVFKEIDEGTKVEEDEDIYLRCSEGYDISGSNHQNETKINCSEGMWSHELHCEPASCHSSLPWAFFGNVREVEINREHGGSIIYECLPDHVLRRDGNVTCEYGQWIGNPAICKSINCATDSLKFTGVLKEPNQIFFDGEEFNYTCESPRYHKPEEHNGTAICIDGVWHLSLPLCSAKRCTDPPPIPEHGSVVDLSMVTRAVVNYICEDPYVLVGDSIVQCFYGDWIGEPPECRDSRCYLKDLGDLKTIPLDSQHITLSGEKLNVTCEDGYTLSADLPLCENGVWNRQLYEPLCKRTEVCAIPSIFNGVAGKYIKVRFSRTTVFKEIDEGTEVEEGEDVYFRCSEGYEISGSNHQNETKINCSKGRWSQELHCEPASCHSSDPPVTFFGKVREVEINREHGGSITYECLPDHVLRRDRNVTCEYGQWKGFPPICKPIKCATDSLEFMGVLKEPNQIFFDGDEYNYTCESPRYHKPEEHSGTAICKDGVWHLSLPLCSEKRCTDPPPIPEHGSVVDLSMVTRAVVNYICEDPYVLVGDSIVQCFYGDWIGEPPECRDSRCYLKDLGNLMAISPGSQRITLSGEKLNVTCEEGYTLSGELPMCENGVWNRLLNEPLCRRSRCYTEDLGNLMNLSPETEAWTLSGDKLDIRCAEGYSLKGELPTCENGMWNRYFSESPCEEITCEVPNVPYGKLKELVFHDYEYSFWQFKYPRNGYFRMIPRGNTILPKAVLYLCCENGYSFRGSGAQMVEIQCLRGRWLPHPECQRHRHVPHKKGIDRDHTKFSKPWEVLE